MISFTVIILILNKLFILTTWNRIVLNRTDLQAPALAGHPWINQGDGTSSCTTPQQPTINDTLIQYTFSYLMQT